MNNTVRILSLRAEKCGPRGVVTTPNPLLTWKVWSSADDWVQSSVDVDSAGEVISINTAESAFVAWPFEPLSAGEQRDIRVRVTGMDGSVSPWSEVLPISTGFLNDGDWHASMIGLADPRNASQPALLRTEFEVTGAVRRARIYATAHGVYQIFVNGHEIDDQILKPGWTAYQWRLVHETTDVTALLRTGVNALSASIAGGWFTESYGFMDSAKPHYGLNPAVAVQLEVEYADGSTSRVLTDSTWKATGEGPLTQSGIYAGETFDATKEIEGWMEAGFDDSMWSVVRVDSGFPVPSPRSTPAVRAIEELPVKEIITSSSGETIVDFGQNVVGRLRITLDGKRGHQVTVRHAEVLEDGELGIRPLRNAEATDRYILRGDGPETWEPRFTFHGFRYAAVENWPGVLDPTSITAIVIHSDLERTGWFDSSHGLLNRLHENIVWGMRGNFLYLPTDCPQRDERLGWTGDIQIFSPTAAYLYDVNSFLSSWLEDLALEQEASDGSVPFVVPNVLAGASEPVAAWGDAATIVPWVLFERFGNIGILARQYPSMKAWVDNLLILAGDRLLWEGKFQFGDWLDPSAPADFPADAKVDPDIVASAYLYRSVTIVANTARILDKHADADSYDATAIAIKRQFLSEYVTEAGRVMSDAQTAYALTICFGLHRNPTEMQRMGERLAWLVRANGYRIGTGFVGTPLVAEALSRTGHPEAAGRLLLQTENPSWLYPVTMGATTVWERWDSILEDGTINPGEMTSFNHYALGAIADWMHRTLAGLAPLGPGYREIRIAPQPVAGIDWVAASHETPYGRASVAWERSGGSEVIVSATVPPNSTAEVWLPGASTSFVVGSGTYEWTAKSNLRSIEHGKVSLQTDLGSIIDDPEAYKTISNVIEKHSTSAARSFRTHTVWTSGLPLQGALFQLPSRVQQQIEEALCKLTSVRRASNASRIGRN